MDALNSKGMELVPVNQQLAALSQPPILEGVMVEMPADYAADQAQQKQMQQTREQHLIDDLPTRQQLVTKLHAPSEGLSHKLLRPSYKVKLAFLINNFFAQFGIALGTNNKVGPKVGTGDMALTYVLLNNSNEIKKGLVQQADSGLEKGIIVITTIGTAALADGLGHISHNLMGEESPVTGKTTAYAVISGAGDAVKGLSQYLKEKGNWGKAGLITLYVGVSAAAMVGGRMYDDPLFKLILTSGLSQAFSKITTSLTKMYKKPEILGPKPKGLKRKVGRFFKEAFTNPQNGVIAGAVLTAGAIDLMGSPIGFNMIPADPHQNHWVTALSGIGLLNAAQTKNKVNNHNAKGDAVNLPIEKAVELLGSPNSDQALKVNRLILNALHLRLDENDEGALEHLELALKILPDLKLEKSVCDKVESHLNKAVSELKSFIKPKKKGLLKASVTTVAKGIILAAPGLAATGLVIAGEKIMDGSVPAWKAGVGGALVGVNKMVAGGQVFKEVKRVGTGSKAELGYLISMVAFAILGVSLINQTFPSKETANNMAVAITLGTFAMYVTKMLRRDEHALPKGYQTERHVKSAEDKVARFYDPATTPPGSLKIEVEGETDSAESSSAGSNKPSNEGREPSDEKKENV